MATSPRTAALLAWASAAIGADRSEPGSHPPFASLAELKDGKILGEIFANISGEPRTPLAADPTAVGAANMRRLANDLRQFYSKSGVGMDGADVLVDSTLFTSVGEVSDAAAVRAAELTLCCITHVDANEEFIATIRSLPAVEQGQIMAILQEGMQDHAALVQHQRELAEQQRTQQAQLLHHQQYPGDDPSKFYGELAAKQTSHLASTELERQLREREEQLSDVQAELTALKRDNAAYVSQVQQLEQKLENTEDELQQAREHTERDHEEQALANARSLGIDEDALGAAVAEQHRLSTALASRESECTRLQRRNAELTLVAAQVPQLQDEIDGLQERAQRAEALAARVERLQAKAEESDELRRQVRELEATKSGVSSASVQDSAESLSRQLASAKAQVAKYKSQLTDLSVENNSLAESASFSERKVGLLESERAELILDLETKQTMIDRLDSRIIAMREEHEQDMVQFVQQQHSDAGTQNWMADIQERVEREEAAHRAVVEEMADELDDAKRLAERFKAELAALKGEPVSDPPGNIDDGLEEELLELRSKFADAQLRSKTAEAENKRLLEEVNSLLRATKEQPMVMPAPSPVVDDSISRELAETKERLLSAQRDMSKLEGYLRTAKVMIRDERETSQRLRAELEEAGGPGIDDEEAERYQNEIQSKTSEIERLKQMLSAGKEAALREQRLMSSCLHELSAYNARLRAAELAVAEQQARTPPDAAVKTTQRSPAKHHGSATMAASQRAADEAGAPVSLLARSRQQSRR